MIICTKRKLRLFFPTGYLDALPDIIAAVNFMAAKYNKPVMLVGSSYSASLSLKVAKENSADLSGAMNILDSQTGGLASSLTTFSSGGLKKTIKGFMTLKTLAMASVFGLIIGAITALKTAFFC